MLDVIDLSKYVITYADEVLKRPINNQQLPKILYYIKGTLLAKYDYKCFNEEIKSFNHGPVILEAYLYFRRYGVYHIHFQEKDLYDEKSNYILNYLDDQPSKILKTINEIIAEKSYYNALELARMTQSELPWEITARNQAISDECLKNFFIMENTKSIENRYYL